MRKAAAIALMLLAGGCGWDQPDSADDLDVVATAPQPGFDFAAVSTYTLPDTIAVIQVPNNPQANTQVNTTMNQQILDQIAAEMNSRGYTRLTDPNGPKPDIFMQVSAMATTSTDVYYNYWSTYWGASYSPWYGAGFGVGYAPVATPYVYQTTVGSLIMNITNPNQPDDQTNTIPSPWIGVVNGILGNSETTTTQRVSSGINQAFEQSPYLTRNSP